MAENTVNTKRTNTTSPKKRGKRRMKKQVRRTIAALFMASAITVAAIPVEPIKAADPTPFEVDTKIESIIDDLKNETTHNKVAVLNYTTTIDKPSAWENSPSSGNSCDNWNSTVPHLDKSSTVIYTSQEFDGGDRFRFAFAPSANGKDKVAIILGHQLKSSGTLHIPATLSAYKNYKQSTGTGVNISYCAVSKDGSYLYYYDETEKKDGSTTFWEVYQSAYHPLGNDKDVYELPSDFKTKTYEPNGTYHPTEGDEAPKDTASTYKKVEEKLFWDDETEGYKLEVRETKYVLEPHVRTVILSGNAVEEEYYTWTKIEEPIDGSPFNMTQVMVKGYAMCFDKYADKWEGNGTLEDDEKLFYCITGEADPDRTDTSIFKQVSQAGEKKDAKMRIHDVDVCYIGEQVVTQNPTTLDYDIDDTKDPVTTPSDGVFAGISHTSVEFPDSIIGIGNGAFYDSSIMSANFGAYINTIGDYAFANCKSLKTVSIPTGTSEGDASSGIRILGQAAFADTGLSSFTIPGSLMAIGDYCFAGSDISTVDVSLSKYLDAIGYRAFANCTQLKYVELPKGFYQDSVGLRESERNKLPIETYIGCTAVRYIKLNNDLNDAKKLDITDEDSVSVLSENHAGSNCNITTWKNALANNLKDSFFFEGSNTEGSKIYATAKRHQITFKRVDQEVYEIFKECDEDIANKHVNTFIVNNTGSSGQLMQVLLESDAGNTSKQCKEVTVPSKFGTYDADGNPKTIYIDTLLDTSFSMNQKRYQDKCKESSANYDIYAEPSANNLCYLETVHIPSSITQIYKDAFKGDHNLKYVVFEPATKDGDDYNYNCNIAPGAFATQLIDCEHELAEQPELSFTGPISSGQTLFPAYDFAMNTSNNINAGSQPTTYITYYTDFPSLLKVQLKRDPADEGVSTPFYKTLVDYPSMSDLADKKINKVTYPFIDSDQESAAMNAYDAYSDPAKTLSGDQERIIEATLKIDVPYGVEAISDGLFSGYGYESVKNTTNNNSTEYITKPKKVDEYSTDISIEEITLHSISNIDPYTFKGCESLKKVDISGSNNIGDYAFCGDKSLNEVTIDQSTLNGISYDPNSKLITGGFGIRPFRGCTSLKSVDFGSGSSYSCEDALIFGTDSTGNKYLLECLETRGTVVGEDYAPNGKPIIDRSSFEGVASIQKEAFMNCDGITSVNLKDSAITFVPERAFAGASNISSVILPNSVTNIKRDAFLDSGSMDVTIPNKMAMIDDQYVFGATKYGYKSDDDTLEGYEHDTDNPYLADRDVKKTVNFKVSTDSVPANYADSHIYINVDPTPTKYTVRFMDTYDPTSPTQIGKDLEVDENTVLTSDQIPATPSHPDKEFLGWNPDVTKPITDHVDFETMYSGSWFTVSFYLDDKKDILLDYQANVQYGASANPPEGVREKTNSGITAEGLARIQGMYFVDWITEGDGDYSYVTKDLVVYAKWYPEGQGDLIKATFYDDDGSTVLFSDYYSEGEVATPITPTKKNATFKHWIPSDLTISPTNCNFYAQWKYKSSNNSGGGSNNGGGGSNNGGSDNPDQPEKKKYNVTVINGSGSGTYEVDSTVIIAANTPATGKAFEKWTTSDVTLASTVMTATTFKMPAKNVTVTANYVDAKTTTVKTASGNSARPVSTGQTVVNTNATGNTSLLVSKGGLSSVDLASATVRGSNDSFVVKVTENNEATTAVANALNNRYGSLDGIEYWACDISLYDSTGNTKISDTTGLQVDITLPLPDGLKMYGGNNKAGAVANNQLEDLNTKFNTINGTPTITFTATHFSPYVIYVDGNNLDAGQMLDASPKTGDPIHPKWFLSMGLAAASIVLFLKKDKKRVKVATV